MKLLQSIDLFGQKVKIYVGKKEVHNSAFGGLLTLLMLLSLSIFTWLIGKDLIERKNPLSYQQSLLTTKYPIINLPHSLFGITVTSWDGKVLKNDTIFSIDVKMYKFKTDDGGTYYPDEIVSLPMEPCEPQHFPQMTEDELKSTHLDLFMCLKNTGNISLFGYWIEQSVNYIEITVSLCVGPGCASDDQIRDYIYNTKLSLNMISFQPLIDNKDYDRPIRWAPTLEYIYVQTEMNKFIEYGIQRNYIYTDAGYLLNDEEATDFLELKNTVPSQPMNIDPAIRQLLICQIYSNHKYTAYYRKYIKIPEIIASVGGLLKIYLIVFQAINSPLANIVEI
jgi:hypothetical protein